MYLFLLIVNSERGKSRHRGLPSAASLRDSCHSQDRARLRSAASTSTYQTGGKGRVLLSQVGVKWSSLGSSQCSCGMLEHRRQWFNPLHHNTNPKDQVFMSKVSWLLLGME